MYIKSVIIDGFKSYGTRTEINGFDPEFNAITGLNGTGKSNILDSICFVLGISNLTHVRADRLQDLIYKSGQAGVTKASVTIVFDNTDTSKSPMNYEQYKEITVARQIVVAGKNRYLINGSTVTNKSVTDFFSSIQLNVNNPHFLIMQGRITKVLNMKPPEILSMIEEAAGTRMYENKKQGAQKTIEKKDGKLKDINDMVCEQLNPKLERMKDERSMYIEYQKVQKELDQLTAVYIAWEYQNTEATLTELHKQKEIQKTDMENAKQLIDDGKLKSAAVDKDISELQKLRDTECGGQLDALETELKDAEKVEATILAKLKGQKDTISGESRQQKQLDKIVKDDEKALVSKNSELSKVQGFFEKLREEEKQDAEALTAAQKRYQAVSSGLLQNEDGGEDATLQDQLMGVKKSLSELETEVKKCTMQLQHDKKELESKKPLLKKTENTYENDRRELEVKEKELEALNKGLKRLNYEEGQLEALQEEMRTVSTEMRGCAETVNNYKYRLPQLSFEYQDPEPNFNHQKVRGLLCKLFSVKDPKYARAVETAAGGKLFSVVVDDERISSKLIEKGQLARRTTFAPLNQIQGSTVDQNTFRRAQHEEGNENVFLAQSLIEYDRKYESIMAWAFGQTLICTNIDTAERISTGIRKRAVTLDGDVFDPSGIISGGAVDKNQPILLALIELMKAEKEFAVKQKHFNVLNEKLVQMGPIANNYEEMKHKMCLREREVEMVRMRLQQTSHYQLQQELDKLQESIDSKEANIREWKIEIKEKTNRASELENKLKNMKAVQEKAIADAESELKRIKKKAEDSRNNWKQREQEFETLNLEIQELQNSVQAGKEQILKSQEIVAKLEDKLAEINEELASCQENTKRLKDQVKSQKEEINKKNKELKELAEKKETIVKLLNDTELRFKKCTLTIGNLESDIKDTNKILNHLKEKHKWIETDQQYFGQPNGRYDFEQYDQTEVKQKLAKLQESKEKLSKYVNAKSFDMLGNQEERVQDVMTKKTIIEEDRSKILSVIEELDVRKKEVIRRAWDKVNNDFHSILSSLLPSAQARLKPVDGYDFMHGLEVKVGFGGIWKESLDELSGGQRSLVALSLILAMLLFKPAPLYILDEVDAALDASHTQNIGQMLKAHFKQSQFLVVSLKDGMFNNANVLFRTAFVDGMSAVIRTVPGKK